MPTGLRGHGKPAMNMATPSSGHGTLRSISYADINSKKLFTIESRLFF